MSNTTTTMTEVLRMCVDVLTMIDGRMEDGRFRLVSGTFWSRCTFGESEIEQVKAALKAAKPEAE